MIQADLAYYRDAAVYLQGDTSKAVALIDHFIAEHGAAALPEKSPQEMMSLIMNIDRAGFGALDEELFSDSKRNVLSFPSDHIERVTKKQAQDANSDQDDDLGHSIETKKYYRSYFLLSLGGAVSFGIIGMWFLSLRQTISFVVCGIITLVCSVMMLICHNSYKHSGRINDEVIGRKRQAI